MHSAHESEGTAPELDFLLRRMPAATMINLRGSAEDLAFAETCCNIIGLALVVESNRFDAANGRSCLWQGPDEWLIVVDNAGDLERRLDNALSEFHHAVTDVSGNRVILRLSGPRATELLAAGCTLDLDSAGPGTVVQTLLARMPVTILKIDDDPTFDLLVRRSFASYLENWLLNVAELAGLRR